MYLFGGFSAFTQQRAGRIEDFPAAAALGEVSATAALAAKGFCAVAQKIAHAHVHVRRTAEDVDGLVAVHCAQQGDHTWILNQPGGQIAQAICIRVHKAGDEPRAAGENLRLLQEALALWLPLPCFILFIP